MEGRLHHDSYPILEDNHLAYYGRDDNLHLAKVKDGVLSEDKVIYDTLCVLNEEEGFKYVPVHLPENKVFVLTNAVTNYLMDYDGEKKVVISPAGQMENFMRYKKKLEKIYCNI